MRFFTINQQSITKESRRTRIGLYFVSWFRKILILLVLSIGTTFTSALVAQENLPTTGPQAPTDTTILLPEIVIELENPRIQPVPGLLPALDDLRFQGVQAETNLVGRLSFDSDLYRELLQPAAGVGTLLVTGASSGFQSVYTRGMVGLGLHQFLRGSVSIYQLGVNPELRFDFDHRTIDGALVQNQWRQAGSGFSSQLTRFAAESTIDLQRSDVNLALDYAIEKQGFQNQADDLFGSTLQNLGARVNWVLDLTDRLDLDISTGYRYTRRYYDALDSDGAEADAMVWQIDPKVELLYLGNNLELSTRLGYELTAFPQGRNQHVLRPEVAFQWNPLSWLTLHGLVGGHFDLPGTILVPFEIGAEFTPVDQVVIGVQGGYRTEVLNMTRLWQEMPTASRQVPSSSLHQSWWFGDLYTQFFPLDTLDIEFGLGARVYDQRVIYQEFDENSFSNPWVLSTFQQLNPRARIQFRPVAEFLVSTSWLAQFLDTDPLKPDQQIDLRFEFRQTEGRFGAILENNFFLENPFPAPVITLTGWLSLARVVDLELSLIDPFSVFVEGGRLLRGGLTPFRQTGFRGEILVSLNL
jgi:hypothetical protein